MKLELVFSQESEFEKQGKSTLIGLFGVFLNVDIIEGYDSADKIWQRIAFFASGHVEITKKQIRQIGKRI